MNKIKQFLITTIAIVCLSTSAFAGSFGIGVSGTAASVSASGTETTGAQTAGTAQTDNSVVRATAGNRIMFGSVFAEYNFLDSERFTLGIDYIPGEADVNKETLSRTDTNSDGTENNLQAGTRKANAKISDHVTYYGELVLGAGIYGKVGFAQVDIKTTESTATTVAATTGSYPNKTLDAWTYGIGQKGNLGKNGFYKVEGFITDYDTFSATSTGGVGNANTVSADLDVVGASLKIGLKF